MYLSGIYALNIPCNLETCGDWHQSALDWHKIVLLDENDRFFGSYGIEKNKAIPEHHGTYSVANTLRACLDLMEDSKFSVLSGMKRDFLGTSKYNNELFSKVYEMRELNNWADIDNFMKEEFLMEWIKFKQDSYREYDLSSDIVTCINNIQVYNIDTLAALKINAYTGQSKIRDLYDVVFICKNHWEELKDTTKGLILQGFAFKGFDYFDYISKQQADELIDINKLRDDFLELLDKLGLLDTEVEAQYAETFDLEEPDR